MDLDLHWIHELQKGDNKQTKFPSYSGIDDRVCNFRNMSDGGETIIARSGAWERVNKSAYRPRERGKTGDTDTGRQTDIETETDRDKNRDKDSG